MTIKDIQNIMKDTTFNFEHFHDFRGMYDRYKPNHDVIIGKVDDIFYRICAINRNKNIWKVLKVEDTYTKLVENVSLEDALKFVGAV